MKYIIFTIIFSLSLSLSLSAQSPGGVSGNNLLWMKGDSETYEDASPGTDATEDADAVYQWHDQSGNSHDATQATGAYPVYDEDAFNFNPGLVFTAASNQYLAVPNGIFDANMIVGSSAYVVSSHSTATVSSVFNEPLANTNEDFMFLAPWNTDDIFWQVGDDIIGSGRAHDVSWEASTDGTQYIWSMGNNSSNATSAGEEQYVRLDGHIVDTQNGYDATAQGNSSDFYIGKWEGNTSEFDGTIAELIVFDKILSATEEIQVQSYLAIKYGITLNDDADNDASFGDVVTGTIHEGDYLAADGSTEIWDYDNDKLFHFDVAGIGADATSGLDQRQSKSLSSDAIVTMSTEAIGTLNSSISTALTDDAYLLWGNDNATTSANADLPAGYTGRLPKEWIVKMTGTVADVHIQFDLPIGQQLAGDAAGDYYILIDADGDFTSGAVATVATSFSTGKVTFSDIDFTDGQYFTLATQQTAPGNVATHLELWLKADAETYEDASPGTDATEDADDVLQWHDQSGLSHDATVTTGSYPHYDEDGINFNPSLTFTQASSEYLAISGGLFGTDNRLEMTSYVVITSDGAGTENPVFTEDLTGSEDFFMLAPWATDDYYYSVGGTGTGSGWISDGAWQGSRDGIPYLLTGGGGTDNNTPGGDELYIRTNGEIETTSSNDDISHAGNSSDFNIGRWHHDVNEFGGEIAEMIIYDGIPSVLDELQIQSYLAIKYGITLTDDNDGDASAGEAVGSLTEGDYVAGNGTTVLWDYSAYTTFHNDIAGLGRDDDMGLHQKQSKSANSDAIVTMSTEAIGTTNAGISTTLTDDAYLLWGNDNASTSAYADLPTGGGYTGRLQREWVVEMTGTVSNVHIEFNIADFNLAGDAAADFYLLTDANGDFTASATATAATSFSSNKVTFNDINFTDGQYFTLATKQPGPGGVSGNLRYWVKADAEAYSDAGSTICTNGQEVQEFHDQSGNSYDATDNGATGPDWDEDGVNFNPALDFEDANSENLEIASGLFGTDVINDLFIYIVAADDEDRNDNLFGEVMASSQYVSVHCAWGNEYVYFDMGNQVDGQGRTGVVDWGTDYGITHLWGFGSGSTTGTPNGTKKYILRDNTVLDSNDPSTGNTPTGNDQIFSLGSGLNSAYLNGRITEMVIYDGIPTETEEDQIQTYLAVKYGITLAAEDYVDSDGSTIIWDYSANTAYHYDIAGIGADATSGLDQRQSKSINSDAIVTMSTEAIGTTNAGISTALTDDAYLLWGNNNASASSETDLPSGYTGRLEKEWVVEMTGTVSNVHVEFNLSSLHNLAGDAAGDYYILIDADGDFTSGAVATVASLYSTDKITFNDINFTDGYYFTLATQQAAPGGVGSNLHAWWKADAGTSTTTDDAAVATWTDQSNHAFSGAQTTTGADYWENGINFNPILRFTENNEDFTVTNGIYENGTKDNMFSYVVSTRSEQSDEHTLFYQEMIVANDQFGMLFWNSNATFYYEGDNAEATGHITAPWGGTLDQPHLWVGGAAENASTPGGNFKYLLRDNTSYDNAAGTSTVSGGTNNFRIGCNHDGNYDYNGDIAEIIIFDGIPSALEEDQIQSYLAIKYGITLASSDYYNSSGTVVWDNTTYSAYHYDVAGIGRDDAGSLLQKQSKSISSDEILTISTEAIAADNDANSTTLTDGAYLLWGNNNASTSADADLPAGYTGRLEKEWVVEMTETVADVHVEFDLSSSERLAGDAAGDYFLLIDADGDFTSGATATASSSFASSKVTFNDIDFTDGQYFTLASQQPTPGGVATNLELWMKADAGVTGSTPVTAWADQSTSGFSATNTGNSPDLNSSSINYNPGLTFDDDNSEYLDITSGIFGTENELSMFAYVVVKNETDAYSPVFSEELDAGNAIDEFMFLGPWNNDDIYFRLGTSASAGNLTDATWGATNGQAHLWSMGAHSSASTPNGTFKYVKLDGTTTVTTSSSDPTSTGEDASFFIGHRLDGQYYDGDIAELIVLDGVPSAAEENRIQSYLAIKYGITLAAMDYTSSEGTVIWDNATYSANQYDIAGISRDDLSGIDQRQAKSENSDAIITMSTEAIAATNTANSTQLSADQSFLLWGNNNGAVSVSTSELHATFAERLPREWVVEETGTVGSVVVEVDITGLAFADEVAANFGLVIDDDGDFTGGTQSWVIADDLTSDKVTFNAVDFTDGKYFTLMNSATALPVELLSFEVEPEGCFAHLTWTTGSEINNDYFIVQYSYDAINWQEIDKVHGAGNSSEVINYSFYDLNCFHQGKVYYRLVQVDFDGTKTNSKVKSITIDQPYSVRVYPNPTTGIITVNLDADLKTGPAVLIVRSIDGRAVYTSELGNGENVIDLSRLASDTYVFKVSVPDQLPYYKRVVKVK